MHLQRLALFGLLLVVVSCRLTGCATPGHSARLDFVIRWNGAICEIRRTPPNELQLAIGRQVAEHARALINIAALRFREPLERASYELHLLP
jgi:hypothetical protein